MSEKIDLLPCPCCGSDNLDFDGDSVMPDNLHGGSIRCVDCDARGPECESWANSVADAAVLAASAWNRRAVPEPEPGDRERARQWGFNNSLLESQIVDLAAEFARVRAEQKEMDAVIAAGMIDRNDAGKIDHDDIGSITALDIRDAIRKGEP